MAMSPEARTFLVERRTFLELVELHATEPVRCRGRAVSDFLVSYPCTARSEDEKSQRSSATTTPSDAASSRSWASDVDSDEEGSQRGLPTRWADHEDEEVAAPAQSSSSRQPRHPPKQRVNPWAQETEATCDGVDESQRTTLVLKQLPLQCSQTDICGMLDALGLQGFYDFLYAPINFKTLNIFGYCFVNLLSHEVALEAQARLSLVSFGAVALEVQWSDPHQGLEVQLERYRNSPVMHKTVPVEYKPVQFRDGRRVPLPKPTKMVRAPQEWTKRKQTGSQASSAALAPIYWSVTCA